MPDIKLICSPHCKYRHKTLFLLLPVSHQLHLDCHSRKNSQIYASAMWFVGPSPRQEHSTLTCRDMKTARMWQMLLKKTRWMSIAFSHNTLIYVPYTLTKNLENCFKYISLTRTLIDKKSNAIFANTQLFLFPFLSDLQLTGIQITLCFTGGEQIVEGTN